MIDSAWDGTQTVCIRFVEPRHPLLYNLGRLSVRETTVISVATSHLDVVT